MRWESDSLAHYGIKGQQWGVRRFQNEDGTLTQAGKERYYKHLDREDSLDDRQNKDASNTITKENVWEKMQENYDFYTKTYGDEAKANEKYKEVSFKEYFNAEKEFNKLTKKHHQTPNSTYDKYASASKEYDDARKSNHSKEELERLNKKCKELHDESIKEDLFIMYNYVMNNYPKQKVNTLLAMLYAGEYYHEFG